MSDNKQPELPETFAVAADTDTPKTHQQSLAADTDTPNAHQQSLAADTDTPNAHQQSLAADTDTPNAHQQVEVTVDDLPLHCPMQGKRLWDSHPKVYLAIEDSGQALCPYCATAYVLKTTAKSCR